MMSSMLKYYASASNTMRNSLLKDQRGVAMLEYALIASLIAVVVLSALGPLGIKIRDTFTFILGQLP